MNNDANMMEVDAELNHSKGVKRLDSDQAVVTVKPDLSLPEFVTGHRKKIRAKRVNKVSNFKFIVVLDTNILISHLSDLKKFLSQPHIAESFSLIIPLIVIQELDFGKSRCDSRIKFINEQLRASTVVFSDKIWLDKYPDEIVSEVQAKVDKLTELNNDDKILKTALVINEVSDNSVILVTNDLNLENKGIAATLETMNWNAFCNKFGIVNTSSNKNGKVAEEVKPLENKLPSSSLSEPKAQIDFRVNNTQFGAWLTFKYSAEQNLKQFLEKVLRELYGELWDKIYKLDFSNCTFVDILRCLKHGWIGTFSDSFRRDNSIFQTITTLLQLMEKESDINQLTKLVNKLLKAVGNSQVTSYNSKVQNVNKRKKRK